MKNSYEKPLVEIIEFKVKDLIMDGEGEDNIGIGGGPSIGEEGVEDW